MSSFFILTLDTLAPQGVELFINDGALYTSEREVFLTITTTDTDTTGYQMKIWGTSTVSTEEAALWETFTATKSITLPGGDGMKTVSVKLRDSVLNESNPVTAQIYLDTAVPIVDISYGPDVDTLSLIPPADQCNFAFIADEDFVEYKVKVVPDTSSLHDAGAAISTINGSVNMYGANLSGYLKNTPINCIIMGTDLQLASNIDGLKIVKVFVKDKSGNWSVA